MDNLDKAAIRLAQIIEGLEFDQRVKIFRMVLENQEDAIQGLASDYDEDQK